MKICIRWRAILSLIIFLSISTTAFGQSRELDIAPVQQQTPAWCWAAVSQMVLEYFNVPPINPNFQCGIVALLGPQCSVNCFSCIIGIGSTPAMADILGRYQSLFGFNSFNMSLYNVLPPREIVDLLDEGLPIIAGISPSGLSRYFPQFVSEHVVLVVGYEDRSGRLYVKINDPMPYHLVGYDPFIAAGGSRTRAGSYWIEYESFVYSLGYKDTIVVW